MSDPTPPFTALPLPSTASECLDRAENHAAMDGRDRPGAGQAGDARRAADAAPRTPVTHGTDCLLARYRRPASQGRSL